MENSFTFIANNNTDWQCNLEHSCNNLIVTIVTNDYTCWKSSTDDPDKSLYNILNTVMPDYNFTKEHTDDTIILTYDISDSKIKMNIQTKLKYDDKIIKTNNHEIIFIEEVIDRPEQNHYRLDRIERKLYKHKRDALIGKNADGDIISRLALDYVTDELVLTWINLTQFLTPNWTTLSKELSADIKDNRVFLNGAVRLIDIHECEPVIMIIPNALRPKNDKYILVSSKYDTCNIIIGSSGEIILQNKLCKITEISFDSVTYNI